MKPHCKIATDAKAGDVSLNIQGMPHRVLELKTALSTYLNTRPEAPPWLWRFCDMLEEKPIPVTSTKGHVNVHPNN